MATVARGPRPGSIDRQIKIDVHQLFWRDLCQELYALEREIRAQGLDIAGTTRVQQERAKPLLKASHA